MRAGLSLSLVGAVAIIAACDAEPAPLGPAVESPAAVISALGRYAVVAIDSPTVLTTIMEINNAGVAVGQVDSNAVQWKDGVFTALPFDRAGANAHPWREPLRINNRGDITGIASGVPMILLAGTTVPERLFRADTNATALVPVDVNDHREVLVALGSLLGGKIWKAGQYTNLPYPASSCATAVEINNQSVILLQEFCFTTNINHWVAIRSVYNTGALVNSGKLQGESCGNGRFNTGWAINDSNEVLGWTEYEPNRGVGGMWRSDGGCRNLAAMFEDLELSEFNSRGVLGGFKRIRNDTFAVVAHDTAWARVDQLLEPGGVWHVVNVLQITDTGLILATGYRVADGRQQFLLLKPL